MNNDIEQKCLDYENKAKNNETFSAEDMQWVLHRYYDSITMTSKYKKDIQSASANMQIMSQMQKTALENNEKLQKFVNVVAQHIMQLNSRLHILDRVMDTVKRLWFVFPRKDVKRAIVDYGQRGELDKYLSKIDQEYMNRLIKDLGVNLPD